MMTSSRLVRGTKGRLFACLGVLTLFAGVIFLYHSTRVELDEVRNSLSKCHQEQDSLAAHVQGIHILCGGYNIFYLTPLCCLCSHLENTYDIYFCLFQLYQNTRKT